MSKYKKVFACLTAILCFGILTGCGSANSSTGSTITSSANSSTGSTITSSASISSEANTEEYLCQGTIPASAKIYPVVEGFEDFPMTIVNASDDKSLSLTDEDIWNFTHYVDVFLTLSDKLGLGAADKKEFTEFMNETEMEERLSNDDAGNNIIHGCQIIIIEITDDNNIAARILLNANDEEVNSENVDEIVSLTFKKEIDGKWYIQNAYEHWYAAHGELQLERDDITGKITVKNGIEF